MGIIIYLVSFLASVIGAICGIGGGVIIKPVLDALRIADVSTISFYSGCTVLAMTTYSVIRCRGECRHDTKSCDLYLAIGAAVGGIVGKQIFQFVKTMSLNPERIGAVQAIALIIVTAATLIYTIRKNKIKTKQYTSGMLSLLIGCALGVLSSFLGIGGGPINLVVLYYFFSADTKTAVKSSLKIIFLSQVMSLLYSIWTGTIPEFSWSLLVIMMFGGITGGIAGRYLNKKIDTRMVEKLFLILMVIIIMINIYNIYLYL